MCLADGFDSAMFPFPVAFSLTLDSGQQGSRRLVCPGGGGTVSAAVIDSKGVRILAAGTEPVLDLLPEARQASRERIRAKPASSRSSGVVSVIRKCPSPAGP